MSSRTGLFFATVVSVLAINGARQYLLRPDIVGTRKHDGVQVAARSDNYLLADRVLVAWMTEDERSGELVMGKQTRWSFRPVILDGDILHSFA